MSATDIGFTTTTKGARQAAARTEASATLHILRDRSTLFGGICTNCEKLEHCPYPSTTTDTWYCEEYSVARADETPHASSSEVDELPDRTLGLCVNCEARGTCTLAKPAGGVWFCNEYE